MLENGVDHAVFLGGGGVPVKMTDEYFFVAPSDGSIRRSCSRIQT